MINMYYIYSQNDSRQTRSLVVTASLARQKNDKKYSAFQSATVNTDHSKVVPLLQFFFVCTSVVSYVTFVLSLFDPHFFWCLRKAPGYSHLSLIFY